MEPLSLVPTTSLLAGDISFGKDNASELHQPSADGDSGPEDPVRSEAWRLFVGEVRFATVVPRLYPRIARVLCRALQMSYPEVHETEARHQPGPGHVLWSPDRTWAVRLEPSALGLETRAFESFPDFAARFREAVVTALPALDTSFYTRVALRSIRFVAITTAMGVTRSSIPWAKHEGRSYTFETFGEGETGMYHLREHVEGAHPENCARDIDFFRENVEDEELEELLPQMFEESLTVPPVSSRPQKTRNVGVFAHFRPTAVAAFSDIVFSAADSFAGVAPAEAPATADNDADEAPQDFDTLNADRIRLLAQKYNRRQFSPQDEARLAILQGQTQILAPPVPYEESHLDELEETVRGVRERRRKRARRLDLES